MSSYQSMRREVGSTLVETALILPVLFLFIFSALDLGRFLAARAVLMKGCQDLLNTAQKLDDVDLDTRVTANTSRYIQVTNELQSRYLSYIGGSFVGSSLNTFTWDILGATTVPNRRFVLLRPGESAVDANNSGVIQHPTRPQIGSTEDLRALLAAEPLYLEVRARQSYVLSIWGALQDVRASAYGYREYQSQPNLMPAATVPTPTIPSTSTTSTTTTSTTSLTSTVTTTTTAPTTTSVATTSTTSATSTTSVATTSSTSVASTTSVATTSSTSAASTTSIATISTTSLLTTSTSVITTSTTTIDTSSVSTIGTTTTPTTAPSTTASTTTTPSTTTTTVTVCCANGTDGYDSYSVQWICMQTCGCSACSYGSPDGPCWIQDCL